MSDQVPPATPRLEVIPLSAETPDQLERLKQQLISTLQATPNLPLAALAYALQRRSPAPYRLACIASTSAELLAQLTGESKTRPLTQPQAAPAPMPVAFLFPGIGDHYLHMVQALYEEEPLFRDCVDTCSRQLEPHLGTSVTALLYPPKPADAPSSNGKGLDLRAMLKRNKPTSAEAQKLQETAVAHPVVFTIEYALAQLLISWGIEPSALVGYSLGEYVAACLAGSLTLPDALELVAQRAALIQSAPEGSMLAVSASRSDVAPWLSAEISLATHNGQMGCVLAGETLAIDALAEQLQQQGIACRKLDTTHAFHSHMLRPLAEQVTALASKATLAPPATPCISNTTGNWLTSAEATDPAYWSHHMCNPVLLFDGLATLLAARKDQILLEVGPGQALGSFAKQHPACTREQSQRILSTVGYSYQQLPARRFLLETLCKLWLLGCQPAWHNLHLTEPKPLDLNLAAADEAAALAAQIEASAESSSSALASQRQDRAARRRQAQQRRKRH